MKNILTFLAIAIAVNTLYADRNDTGSPRLIQGPMLGAVTENSVKIWGRVTGEYPFLIQYSTHPSMEGAQESAVVAVAAEDDFTGVVNVEGLKANTVYYYRVLVDGEGPKYLKNKYPFHFKTAPANGDHKAFTVGFGSCSKAEDDRLQPIWQQVALADPDLFFWVGDNIYADSLYPQFIAELYRMNHNVPMLKELMRSTPMLATWDDHDYGLNDHDRTNPIKEDALKIFQQYWANPSYGEPDNPGVYFKYTYSGVDFFFLDGRYYRDPYDKPDDVNKTMLGAGQLAWLKEELSKSEAIFKVLVCGSGWTSLKGPGGDSWSSFITERDALFQYLIDEKIEGVVLMSGDTHRAEINAIPFSEKGGYDLYEFVSSPLSQDTSNRARVVMPEYHMDEPYTGAVNFGLVSFEPADDPRLVFEVINLYGDSVYDRFVVQRSDLKLGVKTWDKKINSKEHALRKLAEEHKAYGF